MNPNDKSHNLDQDAASRAVDREPHYNDIDGKDPDSMTFNEDEKSYERKKKETVSNSLKDGYKTQEHETERWSTDYISSDRSNYNRNNSRFYWDDYDF
jgi:hypothetical protein